MPRLADLTDDRPLAIDVRLGLSDAAAWYKTYRTSQYSLWPEDPFGASVDHNVWPSVFVRPEIERLDRIALRVGEAPFWDAFNMWDDVREMVRFMRPLPIVTNVIAISVDASVRPEPTEDTALASLIETGLTDETLEMNAQLLGYDIADGQFESALFMSHLSEFDVGDVRRNDYGLVERKADAHSLRIQLQDAALGLPTLHAFSVWALGERPATQTG